MCRLFGCSAGSEPVTATFWLLQAPDSLEAQSHRDPDGTGLGYFDADGTPHIDKQPLAAYGDRAFAEEARTIASATFVAHIRFASTGALEARNTHPFEQQGRLFAHNGVIHGLPALEHHIGARMNLVGGDTDSERLFALITAGTDRNGGDIGAGITTAARWVAANLPIFAINLMLVTESDLWALRYPDTHELHVLERAPGTALHHESSHGTTVHSEHGATRSTVVVASEMMDSDPGWRALESGELIHVGRDLTVSSEIAVPDAPAQLLRLEDLGPHARASQSVHQTG